MPVVSITRLRIRSWRYLLPFFLNATRTSKQARNAEGNLAVSLLNDAHFTFWTRTVWTTEAAMKAYMLTGPHKQVMRHLMDWCDEASVVRWEQQTADEPDWREAHRRMQTEGRPSKVNHPSPAHQKFAVPPPVLPRGT